MCSNILLKGDYLIFVDKNIFSTEKRNLNIKIKFSLWKKRNLKCHGKIVSHNLVGNK